MKPGKQYDVIIVGGSYSGLSAAMALGRALRKVLIIDSGDPCNKQTPHSHNFLTNDGKTPIEIASIAKQQVKKYDTVVFLNSIVTKLNKIIELIEDVWFMLKNPMKIYELLSKYFRKLKNK